MVSQVNARLREGGSRFFYLQNCRSILAGPLIFEYEEQEDPLEAIPGFVKELRKVINP